MSANAGNLLWNRRRINLLLGANDIDTGIKATNQNWDANSVDEPPLGVIAAIAPGDGTPPASRVQVIPMAPMTGWVGVTVGEPWLSTVTGTVHVTLTAAAPLNNVNVLFWCPATIAGPGLAATYNPIA
ncbi:MAG: hypothetical protein ACREJC_07360 [Tepidisphaeraceae bacterium]